MDKVHGIEAGIARQNPVLALSMGTEPRFYNRQTKY